MSNPNITKHMQQNPKGLFLEQSAEYLGLSHGDTSSHPYACTSLTSVQQEAAKPVAAKTPAPVMMSVKNALSSVTAPLNWHAQYCLSKFGKLTPGM